ncbi:hypothetical protein D9758_009279 [Tetrapyrgos nigripes]|uniref:DUF6534 domain-containing protein n=1 Tax=Tetrapyrgos nigripes TaxID=182062 RepID=A0A8H5GHD2_9AGAR|nr:hypothetical protein D9758_009279 [Tetrapyrgos nigripes]
MGLFDDTLGCMLLATAVNMWLFGLSSYQYGVYARSRYDDRLPLRATVLSLFILDMGMTAIGMYSTYMYLVSNFSNLNALNSRSTSHLDQQLRADIECTRRAVGASSSYSFHYCCFNIDPLLLFLEASMLNCGRINYAVLTINNIDRIFRLTRSPYILCGLLLIQTAAFALGLVTGIRSVRVGTFENYPSVRGILTAWLSLQTAVDVVVSVLLVWIFRISRTAFAPTNAVLNRLVRGALQTGIFSSLLSIGYLVAFVTQPDKLVWQVFAYASVRIYSITLMDTLVCRSELKEKLNGASGGSGGNGNGGHREAYQLQPSASQGIIRIHTQIQQETDVEPSSLDRKYAPEDEAGNIYPSRNGAMAV